MENLFEYIHTMLGGPGAFRFLVQPAVALLLGIRDGRADSHAGRSPILSTPGPGRWTRVATALRRVAVPLGLAIGLSLLFQFVILGTARLWVALAFAALFVALPYLLARGLARRADARWHRTHPGHA
jgi:hypothetical protein